MMMVKRNRNVITSTFFRIKFFTLDNFVFLYLSPHYRIIFDYILSIIHIEYLWFVSESSSSSSCRAGSTDIPDPLSPLFLIVHRPQIVAECVFVLVVLLLHGDVWGSIRVHHLWVRPCFSSSVLHVWFV